MMSSTEYVKTLDGDLIKALSEIIVEENKTSRLIRKSASEEFIDDLCQIIDNYSSHWNKGGKNDL